MATIFNYVLQHQEDCIEKTIAIIVYPMNALINSQAEELGRYQQQYEETIGKNVPLLSENIQDKKTRRLVNGCNKRLLTSY